MRRLARIAAAMLVAALLAGCQPVIPPTPSPSTSPPASSTAVPTPTYLCTPEAGGEESPCSQVDYEEMKAKDALYAEAEAVYREYYAENIRISRTGGVTEPTEILLRTTTGSVQENVMDVFRDMVKRGVRAKGNDPTLAIDRAPGLERKGSLVALEVCADASGWAFYNGSKLVSQGRPARERVYFARSDGEQLKMTYTEGKWVESCSQTGD